MYVIENLRLYFDCDQIINDALLKIEVILSEIKLQFPFVSTDLETMSFVCF